MHISAGRSAVFISFKCADGSKCLRAVSCGLSRGAGPARFLLFAVLLLREIHTERGPCCAHREGSGKTSRVSIFLGSRLNEVSSYPRALVSCCWQQSCHITCLSVCLFSPPRPASCLHFPGAVVLIRAVPRCLFWVSSLFLIPLLQDTCKVGFLWPFVHLARSE